MDFLKDLINTFIPRPENSYKPNFFRAKAIIVTAACILVLGAGVFILQTTVVKNTGSLAAVISSVLVDLANTDRTANGLKTLALNSVLTQAAQLKANDMAQKGYFAHTSPDGVTPWHWFKEAGYQFQYAGENLAVRFSDSIDVERAWMNSPAHRANILNSEFSDIGIAIAQGNYNGEQVVFVVQMFGRPVPASVAAVGASFANVSIATTSVPKTVLRTTAKKTALVSKPTTSTVEGTSTAETAVTPRVIVENDTFIAVENTATSGLAAVSAPVSHLSLFTTLFTSPVTVVTAIYFILAMVILVALVLMVFLEIRHQHPVSLLSTLVLLVLMVGLFYVWQTYFPGPLTIL